MSELERLIEQGGPPPVPALPTHLKRHLFMNTGFGVSKLSAIFPFPTNPDLDELSALFFEQGDEVYVFPLSDDARREVVKQLSGGIEVPKLHVEENSQ